MKNILMLAAAASLSLATVAPALAQDVPVNFEEVNERDDLTDEQKALILGISVVAFLGLIAASGGTSGT